ncbi:MAG: hypothetical protein HY314_17595 [Acidobacteria bacterium]|nr:hypothetical protein [Acidobacteriota bacterium]
MVKRCSQLIWLVVLMLPVLTGAVQFYKKKPYVEWSEKEAQKILNNSPWAYTYTFTETQQQFWKPGTNTAGVNEINVNFYIRWLSAKPIRQAFAQLVALQKRPEEDQASLRPKLDEFVSRSFPEHIVLSVDYNSNDGRLRGEVMQIMSSLVTSQLQNNTYLVKSDGEKVWLAEYQPPRPDGLGAKFVFPRMVGEKPFLSPTDKEVRFISELSSRYSFNIRFKVADMNLDGQLEY